MDTTTVATILGAIYLSLWLFFIYGFLGVLAEMIYCWVIEYRGVIESRTGLLYLPINLLYGLGGLVITLVLVPAFENPFIVFGLGMVVGTVIEYVTSLFMEKVFGAVYWDYSKEFLNFQGRICLKYALIWGVMSLFLLYVLDVVNLHLLATIPVVIGLPVLGLLLLATVLSTVLTLASFRRVKQKIAFLRAVRDGQDAELPEPGWARLVDRLVPDTVLINSFPRMSLVTEYQELTGHHRRLIVWLPSIGTPSAATLAAGERARRLEEVRLSAEAPAVP